MVGFREQRLVNFRNFAFADPLDHGFRWVDIKVFSLTAMPPADEIVLAALIVDERFADGYAGAGSDPTGSIHGPYRRSRISADSYERLDATSAIGIVDSWAREFGALPGELARTLEESVYARIRSACSCFRLRDLDATASHEWAGVHTHFHELVTVDRANGTLALIVAADD